MTAPSLEDPAAEVVLGCHVLGIEDQGDPVWGHVSRRDRDLGHVWLKAGPRGFDEVGAEDVVLTDLDGKRLLGSAPVPREYPLHTEVLRVREDVGSVVHCHPPHAIALAATGQPLYAFSNGAGPFAAGVPRYEAPVGLVETPELGADVARHLGDARALFLVGHGIVAVGASVATAVMTAVLLERACRLQLLAAAAGGVAPPLREPGSRYSHAEADGYLLRSWEYLVRRTNSGKDGKA
ncbi:class II aldolase/adducin family protein [Amycolatopsis acidicola]|uniref:class II aldolase/adducin family protein n=1 Tax=Amycolatopsis acidicola TaxID=2596893 RepID=UPI00140C3A46|nr:class II aldolase/adducin family protein [Amycolatopsis acidicola]